MTKLSKKFNSISQLVIPENPSLLFKLNTSIKFIELNRKRSRHCTSKFLILKNTLFSLTNDVYF